VTIETLTGAYAAGHTLKSNYTGVSLTSTAYVQGSRLFTQALATVTNASTISSTVTSTVTLGAGGYAYDLTVTSAGVIAPTAYGANGFVADGSTVGMLTNHGTIRGGVGAPRVEPTPAAATEYCWKRPRASSTPAT